MFKIVTFKNEISKKIFRIKIPLIWPEGYED